MSDTSYYIEQIEAKLKRFKLDVNDCWEYNAIFKAEDNQEYRRRLMYFHARLCKLSDKWDCMSSKAKNEALKSISPKVW